MKKVLTILVFLFITKFSFAQNCTYVFYINPQGLDSALIYVNHSDDTATYSFLWSWGDNTYDSTGYPSHVYSASGTYTICMIVTELQTQCTDTFCSQITILPGHTPFPANVELLTVGITQESPGNFNINPNPVNDKLIINADFQINNLPMTITDISGRTVYSNKLNGRELNCEFLEKGVYLLQIETPSGWHIQQFIKQ